MKHLTFPKAEEAEQDREPHCRAQHGCAGMQVGNGPGEEEKSRAGAELEQNFV